MVLYSLAAYAMELLLPVSALFSRKMKSFVSGRRGQFGRMAAAISPDDRVIWFHSASMGEFEEVRPVIENVRRTHPQFKILVTFFSPSGYEGYKDWKGADWVFYLPVDTPRNARRFIRTAHPEIAVFSITDYWFNHLEQMRRSGTRAYIVSARFIPGKTVFRWYGYPYRRIIRTAFRNILTKDDRSVSLLRTIGYDSGIRCGDPRFDRVISIAETPWSDPVIERFKGGSRLFVAGSTVTCADDDLALAIAGEYPDVKYLFVPHEMDQAQMRRIASLAGGRTVRYSECTPDTDMSDARVMIVDCVGKLARLYRYADWALVGGGFSKGIHSVIEASVYGVPVLTGPVLYNNKPAKEMAAEGINGVASTPQEALEWFRPLYLDEGERQRRSAMAREYCMRNKGATDMITDIVMSE